MNVPTPQNSTARDDAFDRGLERLLQGDPTGVEEIEPDLQQTALEMVKLANDAGWIGTEPGEEPVRSRPWWKNSHQVINAVAAVAVVGLIAVMVTVGVRIWNQPEGQYGSDHYETMITEMGPGVCDRAPRTDAEIAAIVRKSEDDVLPFESDGITAELTGAAIQLTRDWNACLQSEQWERALSYESEHFIWALGQEEFPNGTAGLSDSEVASKLMERQARIVPINTDDGLNLAVYTAENFKYIPGDGPPVVLGADFWLVPVTTEGHWIEWPTVVTIEWDGSQFVLVSASREGVPDSEYFRDDALPEGTPQS